MKNTTTATRASHVNSGTAVKRGELARPKGPGRLLRHPKLHLEADGGAVTAHGGLALPAALVRRLKVAESLDEHVSVLKQHRPFFESDHLLAQVYNCYVGGTCIEDVAALQSNEATCRLLGAARLPDPTTSGDFLRRFGRRDLADFDRALDDILRRVWRARYGRKKQPLAIVDVDTHLKHVEGRQKGGADFTYKGGFGYHPLILSLAHTQEVLRIRNRPGNVGATDGLAKLLPQLFDLLGERYDRVLLRGDSAFYSRELFELCAKRGHHFAVVARGVKSLNTLAEDLPRTSWKSFVPRAKRTETPRDKRRKRGRNRRRRRARQRGKHDMRLSEQWLAEVPYQLSRSDLSVRLIIRRQRIETRDAQQQMFVEYRYRFVVTNLPASEYSPQQVLDLTYQRCDQENIIEQLQNGVPALRMPTGDMLANEAFAKCAQLAHNLKSWVSLLALPAEVVRWKWKRFRHAFVYVGAIVTRHARQTRVRLGLSTHHHARLLLAYQRLRP